MSRLSLWAPVAALIGLAVTLPLNLACGGCPRAGRTDWAPATSDASDQSIAAHETPEHVLLVDDAFVVAADDVALVPEALGADAVHAVIATQSMDLRRCYERARAEHPAAAGRVVLELHVASSGHVLTADVVENALGDGVLAGCFADRARHWHFPESAHDTTLRYPFDLTPAVPMEPPPAAEPPAAAGV